MEEKDLGSRRPWRRLEGVGLSQAAEAWGFTFARSWARGPTLQPSGPCGAGVPTEPESFGLSWRG